MTTTTDGALRDANNWAALVAALGDETMTDLPEEPAEDMGSAWCPTCRRTRTIVDQFLDGDAEMTYGVNVLSCGHSLNGPERRTGYLPTPAKMDRAYVLGRLADES